MRRIACIVLLLGAVALVPGLAHGEPSEACNTGELPPWRTPLGIGLKQAGDPGDEPVSVTVCNTGKFIGPPAKGSLKARVRTDEPSVLVIADGDSDNGKTCTDGYVAAKADRAGAHIYQSNDGGFSYLAREKTPEELARSLTRGCLGL